jgi:hypothetical protein
MSGYDGRTYRTLPVEKYSTDRLSMTTTDPDEA